MIAPVQDMTIGEIAQYIEKLEVENKNLRSRTNNVKKLDRRDAKRIRELYATGDWTQADLGKAFAVNDATISRIIRGVYYPDA